MTRLSPPPLLQQLRQPAASLAEQTQTLRALKNDLIGDDEKKTAWIDRGLVDDLARILESHRRGSKRRVLNGHAPQPVDQPTKAVHEDDLHLQAVILLGCLASESPSYLTTLQKCGIFPALLGMLNPSESSPQLLLAVLRTLNAIAERSALRMPETSTTDRPLSLLFLEPYVEYLVSVLRQQSETRAVQQQVALTCALISKTCVDEAGREQLVAGGVLDALAYRLADFMNLDSLGLASNADPPQHRTAGHGRLAPLLHVVGTIIVASKARSSMFASAASLAFHSMHLSRFPPSLQQSGHDTSQGALGLSASFPTAAPGLPAAPYVSSRYSPWTRSGSGLGDSTNGRQTEDHPVLSWLLDVLRSSAGVTRVMAGWVSALFYRAGLASRAQERSLAMRVTPVLVSALDLDSATSQLEPPSYDISLIQSSAHLLHEFAPRGLALLMADSTEMQRAASEAGAVKRLTQLLKNSFVTLPDMRSGRAGESSAQNSAPENGESPEVVASEQLPMTPYYFHKLQIRESALAALAAMASHKDEYRKAIIENGVIPFVVDSLRSQTPLSVQADASNLEKSPDTVGANPTAVILTACAAAQALSRSVGTLRTSLMDAGLATPLRELLYHPDVDVQIAATAVIANIILEFSPMRSAIIDAGILQNLCQHAHMANPRLKLHSLWAIKHLVHSADNELKISCLQQLGPVWLRDIISGPTGSSSSATAMERTGSRSRSLGTANAAGEQVDLLNSEDISTASAPPGSSTIPHLDVHFRAGEVSMSEGGGASSSTQRMTGMATESTQGPSGAVSQSTPDDQQAVQEQCLDLIRNLICGPESADMIDYLFAEMGQTQVFEMLGGLLRPRGGEDLSRSHNLSPEVIRAALPQTAILVSVCYILVHLAAGLPRHRQLLVSQVELLKMLLPLFSHPHPEIRVCCVWVVINLTWVEDQTDKVQGKARALELSKLGILEQLRRMEADPELDVRERTKAALQQMAELMTR